MKVPKPRKLQSGSWHIQLRINKKSYPITEPTKKLCIQRAQLRKTELLAGKDTRSMDRSVRSLDRLLEVYIAAKKPVLSPSTVRGYEAIRRTRFQAYLDRDPEKINWQRMVSDESRLCGAKTLKNAWALVAASVAFNTGVKPAVTLPQVIVEEHPYLEAEQIPLFLDAIRDTAWELPALLGLHGLRRSEMFALTWSDVSVGADAHIGPIGTIRVRGALVHDETGALVTKRTTKNKTSRRTVPIMIPRLQQLLLSVGADAHIGPNSPVLTCHPNSLYKAVNSICAKNDLPLVGIHGLRHSFASLAHSLGVPEAECMALGGWQDPQTMRKIYTHLDNAARLKASNAIASFYQNANANR